MKSFPPNVFHDDVTTQQWWNTSGPFATLHHINPIRLSWVLSQTSLKDKKVLDLGCGGGIFSEAMSRVGAQVVGMDNSIGSIQIAREHATHNKKNIEYLCGDYQELLPQYTNIFDIITCMEMLEHVESIEDLIHTCHTLLKPGGMVFFSTINKTLPSYLLTIILAEYCLKLLPLGTHDWKKFIPPAELIDKCFQYHLSCVNIRGLSYNPLTQIATLTRKPLVNYCIACKKST